MKRKISLFSLIVLFLCSLLINLCVLFIANNNTITAHAATVGELYNSTTKTFNMTQVQSLITNVFGNGSNGKPLPANQWSSYITTNGETDSGSTILPATKIRAKAGGDVSVTLNGVTWWATSATISTDNNIIVTLFAVYNHGTTSAYYSGTTTSKGANMYASSTLRSNLLSSNDYGSYALFRSGDFATKYLVQPKNIAYQQNQTQIGRTNCIGTTAYRLPNEAYGTQTTDWSPSISYAPSYSFNGYTYDAWKNDYIWIPSASETGLTDRINNDSSIWKLSATQLSHSEAIPSFLRSGRPTVYDGVTMINSNGSYGYNTVGATCHIRPAIHFNLTAAMKVVAPSTPTATATYTGSALGFAINNFDTNIIDLTTVTGKKSDGTTAITTIGTSNVVNKVFQPTLAGTYTLTFNLKQTAKDTGFSWGDATGGTGERKITFTINKKQLSVPSVGAAKTYNKSVQSFSLTNFASGTMDIGGITHTAGNGTVTTLTANAAKTEYSSGSIAMTYDGVSSLSAKDSGDYTVTIALKDKDNYEWTGATNADKTVTLTINKLILSLPTITAKTYNGSAQSYIFGNYDSTLMSVDSVAHTKPSGGASTALTANEDKTQFTDGTISVSYDGTSALSAKDAGTYTAVFALKDEINYGWATTVPATHAITLTMNQKELRYSFTSSTGDMSIESGATGKITVDYASGFEPVTGENPKLVMYYTTSDSTKHRVNATNEVIGDLKLDLTTLTTTGTYTLTLDEVADDDNYKVKATAESGGTLTITAARAGLSSYSLLYDDGTGAKAMPDGNKLPYKLNAQGNAVEYTITLDTTSFPTYLSVDTAYNDNGFTGGYKNNKASTVNTYTMTVRLHSNDATYLFSNGTQDEDKTLTFEIEKGTLDFTGAKWQYTVNGTSADYAKWSGTAWEYLDKSSAVIATDEGVPWCNAEYALRLANLPSGVTANNTLYTASSSKKVIGTYLAQLPLSGLTYDNTNFNTPDLNILKLNWKIVKAEIEIHAGSWTFTTQGTAPNTYQVPILSGIATALAGGIAYEYYDLGTDSAPIALPGTKLSGVSAITTASGVAHYYYAKAVVKSGDFTPGTAWSSLINLTDATGGDNYNETALGDCTKYFETGDNKTIVTVNLKTASVEYTKGEQPAEIEVTSGGLNTTDFVITYELGGVAFSGIPANAGVYTVKVALDSSLESNYVLTGTNSFTYTITPIAYDFTGTKWNYDPAEPFKFEYDGTAAVEKKMRLTFPDGMPEEVADAIETLETAIYGGTHTASKVGNYTATADLVILTVYTGNGFIIGNFNLSGLSAEPLTQKWKIEPNEFAMPEYDGVWTTYDGAAHDIATACGMPEGWDKYFDMAVKLIQPDGNLISNVANTATDAGQYEVTFSVKNGIHTSANDEHNVWLGNSDTQTINFAIAPRTITVTSWKGAGQSARVKFEDTDVENDWYKYVFLNKDGEEVTPDPATKKFTVPGNYKCAVMPNTQNIKIKFAEGCADSTLFTVDEQGGEQSTATTPITLPTFRGGVKYNGNDITINAANASEYFSGFNPEKMTVEEVKGKDVGEYKIVFGIKDSSKYIWDDESNGEVVWRIDKAQITSKWTKVKGVSMIELPEEFAGQDLFDYTYTKADGTEVTAAELVKNETYNVSAKLKAGLEANIDFVDESGALIEGESQPQSFEYTPDLTVGEEVVKFMTEPWIGGIFGWVWACIFAAAFFILMFITIAIIRRRNREYEEYDDYYEDEYEYEDGEDYEEDDEDN